MPAPNIAFIHDSQIFNSAIRDPVWRHIWLTPELYSLTLSKPFLRLYRIKQLGPAEYVYPGATHSRASHSIGVYHVAHKILKQLLERGASSWCTYEGCMSFLAAALLHDLGHFPFTHALKELPLEDHETLSSRIILDPDMATLIADTGADPHMTACIIDKKSVPPSRKEETLFFRNILSGVLDPDKLDYLNRDAYYCGVPYGIQDTDFILSRINPDRNRGIVIDSRATMSVESVLFSKYLMYKAVYWHKNTRIATAMMKKCIYTALTANSIDAEELYELDDAGIYSLIDSRSFHGSELSVFVRNHAFYQIFGEFDFRLGSTGHIRLESLVERSAMEGELAHALSDHLSTTIDSNRILIDVPERISFESDLYISDEGMDFTSSSTIFNREIVGNFTSSLRKIRFACHPELYPRLRAIPDLNSKLAQWCGIELQ